MGKPYTKKISSSLVRKISDDIYGKSWRPNFQEKTIKTNNTNGNPKA